MSDIATRVARLKLGQCPLHGEQMHDVSGKWVRCPHHDCGILGLKTNGEIKLPPGWQFLINQHPDIVHFRLAHA